LQSGRRRLSCVAGIAILIAAGPSQAVEVANCLDLDLDIAECADFSEDGLLTFDFSFLAAADVALEIQTTAGERSEGTLTFRAYVYNDSYLGDEVDFSQVELRLAGGARFETIGSVRNFDFEPVPVTTPNDSTALLSPSPALPPTDLLEIGDLDPEPGAVDWVIDVSQLAGGLFTLRIIAVPEPGGLAWGACAGLGLLAVAGRARRRS